MNTLTALIADDERAARIRIRTLAKAEPGLVIVGEAASGRETIEQTANLRPDVLFLDIQMPPPTGLEVLRTLRDQHLPHTIFVTAFAQHAVEAFAIDAVDYLLKPFTPDRFRQALARARREIELRQHRPDERLRALLQQAPAGATFTSRYLVRNNERYAVVSVDEIEWFESAANYILAHGAKGNQIMRKSMTALERELDPAKFFRVSRSAVVQLTAVVEIHSVAAGEHVLVLKSGARVPMTRNLGEFQRQLNQAR